jgi:hypothetical protein
MCACNWQWKRRNVTSFPAATASTVAEEHTAWLSASWSCHLPPFLQGHELRACFEHERERVAIRPARKRARRGQRPRVPRVAVEAQLDVPRVRLPNVVRAPRRDGRRRRRRATWVRLVPRLLLHRLCRRRCWFSANSHASESKMDISPTWSHMLELQTIEIKHNGDGMAYGYRRRWSWVHRYERIF